MRCQVVWIVVALLNCFVRHLQPLKGSERLGGALVVLPPAQASYLRHRFGVASDSSVYVQPKYSVSPKNIRRVFFPPLAVQTIRQSVGTSRQPNPKDASDFLKIATGKRGPSSPVFGNRCYLA
uniref:Putative secreted protein n=1 Tax=Ixodes ricinus TaxID=34613 RepID=A0A6B0UPF0_IXORI